MNRAEKIRSIIKHCVAPDEAVSAIDGLIEEELAQLRKDKEELLGALKKLYSCLEKIGRGNAYGTSYGIIKELLQKFEDGK